MPVIYKVVNLINKKIYVGQDKYNNENYFGSGILIKMAIKKYGKENFKKIILEYCVSKEDTNKKEKSWIHELQSNKRNIGYNISDGGFGGDNITNHPNKKEIINKQKEIRQNWPQDKKLAFSNKMSQLMKGKNKGEKNVAFGKKPWNYGKTKENFGYLYNITDEQRKKISEKTKKFWDNKDSEYRKEFGAKISLKMKNKLKTNEHKEKISNTLKGKKLSEETRLKISLKHKGKKQKILTCPYCNKKGGTTMHRWHFNNCKEKKEKYGN